MGGHLWGVYGYGVEGMTGARRALAAAGGDLAAGLGWAFVEWAGSTLRQGLAWR